MSNPASKQATPTYGSRGLPKSSSLKNLTVDVDGSVASSKSYVPYGRTICPSPRSSVVAPKKYQAKVRADFDAIEPTELSVKQGQVVQIKEVNRSGWCLAKIDETGASGWVPRDFLGSVKAKSELPLEIAQLKTLLDSFSSLAELCGNDKQAVKVLRHNGIRKLNQLEHIREADMKSVEAGVKYPAVARSIREYAAYRQQLKLAGHTYDAEEADEKHESKAEGKKSRRKSRSPKRRNRLRPRTPVTRPFMANVVEDIKKKKVTQSRQRHQRERSRTMESAGEHSRSRSTSAGTRSMTPGSPHSPSSPSLGLRKTTATTDDEDEDEDEDNEGLTPSGKHRRAKSMTRRRKVKQPLSARSKGNLTRKGNYRTAKDRISLRKATSLNTVNARAFKRVLSNSSRSSSNDTEQFIEELTAISEKSTKRQPKKKERWRF